MATRRRGWLVMAGVLFALAAAFMLYGQDDAAPEAPEVKVSFPRRLSREQKARMEARRTLPALPAAPGEAAPPSRPRDPLLSALPQGRGRTAMVIEANALRHSPVGQLVLECLNRSGGARELNEMRERTGVDPLQDLDRVVVTPDGLMLSGNFGQAKWDALLREGSRTAYGDKGQIYTQPRRQVGLADGGTRETGGGVLGVWNDQLLVMGRDEAEVKQALDRVEGRAKSDEPAITEEQTYGEVYGVVSAEDLARLMGSGGGALGEELKSSGARVELHVDATSDVGVVARVNGDDPARVQDLGKSFGGALAAARVKAQAEGETELASLLDLARVEPRDGRFNLELALPLSFLEQQLARCNAPDRDGDAARGDAEGKASATADEE